MATDLADLRAELRARLLNRGPSAPSDARLDFALRHGIVELSSPKMFRHDTLEGDVDLDTEEGEDEPDLPAAVWTIYGVKDTTTTNIRRLTVMGIQEMMETYKSTGQPLRYARWKRKLHLDPIPSGVFNLKIYCYQYPQFTVVNGVATGDCPLHETFDEGVLLAAEARAWSNILQDVKRGRMCRNDLKDWLQNMVAPIEGELDDQGDVLAPDLDGLLGTGR